MIKALKPHDPREVGGEDQTVIPRNSRRSTIGNTTAIAQSRRTHEETVKHWKEPKDHEDTKPPVILDEDNSVDVSPCQGHGSEETPGRWRAVRHRDFEPQTPKSGTFMWKPWKTWTLRVEPWCGTSGNLNFKSGTLMWNLGEAGSRFWVAAPNHP